MTVTATAAFSEHGAVVFDSVGRRFNNIQNLGKGVILQHFHHEDFNSVSDRRRSDENNKIPNRFVGISSDAEAFSRHCDDFQGYSLVFA